MPPNVDQLGLDDGDVLATLLRRYYPLLLEQAYGDAADLLTVDLAFDLDNPLVQEVLGELAQQVRRVTDTTKDEIRALIGKQADEGWSIPELAAEIRKLGEIHSKQRATLIARTETAAAYSRGSLLAYQQSGVVAAVEWLATLDDLTSPECAALHGTQAPLGEAFADGTLHPPRHPRCRCTLVPVLSET